MRRRLSDDALSTLAEIEAECRDGYADDDAELAEYDEFDPAVDRIDVMDGLAGATHDAAGYPLTDGVEFPW